MSLRAAPGYALARTRKVRDSVSAHEYQSPFPDKEVHLPPKINMQLPKGKKAEKAKRQRGKQAERLYSSNV